MSDILVSASTSDVHAPVANTDAVVTYAAIADRRHAITGVAWSYAGDDPAGGNLKIEDGANNVVFTMDITSEGAGFITFPCRKVGTKNTAMIITLAAGGGSVSGKVSVLNHDVVI